MRVKQEYPLLLFYLSNVIAYYYYYCISTYLTMYLNSIIFILYAYFKIRSFQL